MTGTLRRALPAGLGGLAGLACALCCLIPILLAAGVLGGAGWAAFGRMLPGIALALAAGGGLAWWLARRRRAAARCGCGTGHSGPAGGGNGCPVTEERGPQQVHIGR